MPHFDNKMGKYSPSLFFEPSVNPPLESFHCSASVISVAVHALQKPKMKICEQAPAFNFRLLHLRCATAAPLGLIAALYLPHFDHKIVVAKGGRADGFLVLRPSTPPLLAGLKIFVTFAW